jgi:hypothetical protein
MPARLRILLLEPGWEGPGDRRRTKVNGRAIHPLSLGVVAAVNAPR